MVAFPLISPPRINPVVLDPACRKVMLILSSSNISSFKIRCYEDRVVGDGLEGVLVGGWRVGSRVCYKVACRMA